MKVRLTRRHYGVHSQVDETNVVGVFSDYATPAEPGNPDRDDWVIDEDKLLAALPEGFLPADVSRVLLGTENDTGGTAYSGTTRFLRWAKYFDAYMIWLQESPEGACPVCGVPMIVESGLWYCAECDAYHGEAEGDDTEGIAP